ncbi:OsmC family protein [Egicoccus sp. AB-alg2]|uniref:OsmC family protein n=1 Tax=Egicoccus sp. AB-alg2 TaxID=3242693 RepID=UPI00359D4A21
MHRNGLDLTVLERSTAQLAAGPAAGATRLRVTNRWAGAFAATARADELRVGPLALPRDHEVGVDLPTPFGGHDRAPAPGELLLSALTGCVLHQFVQHAAVGGLDLDGLTISAEGHLDLRGSLGVPGVEPGMTRIALHAEVATEVDDGALRELLASAVATSPVAGSLRGSVHLDAEAEAIAPVRPTPTTATTATT